MVRTCLHLKPGQTGTKQLLAPYGDHLVCVRYHYDAQRKKRIKTVEIITVDGGQPHVQRLSNFFIGIPQAFGTRIRLQQNAGMEEFSSRPLARRDHCHSAFFVRRSRFLAVLRLITQ